MSKNLKPQTVVNELKGSVFFTDTSTQQGVSKTVTKPKTGVAKSTSQSTDRPTSQPTDRLTDQSTSQSTDQLTNVDTLGPIVGRPRSFYITLKVDRWLDKAVEYLKTKGLHKVDRSVLVNTLLHNPELFTPSSLDKIRQRLLAHLTNKSLKRAQSTDRPTD